MKKILLVDDSEMYVEVASNYLKPQFEVVVARSGNEALNFLAGGFIPDLILLDILMPEMDGWETYNIIKGISLLRDVPIAFLTAIDDEAEKDHAAIIGASAYITKPFKKKTLLEKVNAIIQEHETNADSTVMSH